MSGPTQFGFDWGPIKVERLCHVEGRGYSLEVRTDHARVQLGISEKGRKITVHELEPYRTDKEDA